ncbi:hypothetical protein [Pseudomonas atagonensis]|uniref:hypothetical protein n=1 Tax=Pseudomonas atagonensis TaxID=2609964 RepID=UPI001FE8A6B4|nr:hypothetical protein [Pseudomonas atagonensis]
MIYSISPHDIGSAMFIGAAILGLGLFLRSRLTNQRLPSRPALVAKFVVAALIAVVFIGAPVKMALHTALPHCAFDKNGQQLTVCLSDDDEQVFVD